ncbi:glycoside_hydrolase family 16 protein [Hexamita inflata]|uniref:Glycoside hydrolase family 16 protein n=1 Tax=Hexamita inflata TaxID=28002 RepID=A0AA86NDG6_9EUKA|nr:glycoside hydrolase family 16 protein [Hexamita inflata]
MLHIVAQKENLGSLAYTSAKLITANTQYFTYGRFDIRAKLPTGAGTWPAIWLVSEDDTYQEIDIMESWGSDPGKVYFAVHSSNNFTDENDHHGTNLQVNDLESSFHVYSVEWTPNHIYGFVDDVKYFSLFKSDIKRKYWHFDKGMYIILNLAVIATDGICDCFPQEMLVDFVKVYKYIGSEQTNKIISGVVVSVCCVLIIIISVLVIVIRRNRSAENTNKVQIQNDNSVLTKINS